MQLENPTESSTAPVNGEGPHGDPGTTRTCDLLLRRQLLYPAELRDQLGFPKSVFFGNLSIHHPLGGSETKENFSET